MLRERKLGNLDTSEAVITHMLAECEHVDSDHMLSWLKPKPTVKPESFLSKFYFSLANPAHEAGAALVAATASGSRFRQQFR